MNQQVPVVSFDYAFMGNKGVSSERGEDEGASHEDEHKDEFIRGRHDENTGRKRCKVNSLQCYPCSPERIGPNRVGSARRVKISQNCWIHICGAQNLSGVSIAHCHEQNDDSQRWSDPNNV